MSLILYVNSRNRSNSGGTDSNFEFYFEQLANPIRTFTKISLLNISIPKTYFLVDNNEFFLIEGSSTITLSMPHGNYNIMSFAETLSQVLINGSINGFIYKVTSDIGRSLNAPITGMYKYIIQGNINNLPVSIEVGTTLFEQFGFNRNSTN